MQIKINEYVDASWYILKMKNVEIDCKTFIEIGYFIPVSNILIEFFKDKPEELMQLYHRYLDENKIQDFLIFIIGLSEYEPQVINYGLCEEQFKESFDILIKCGFIELKK